MSDPSSNPKGSPPGRPRKGDTVPALDARAAAEEALRRADEKLGVGETLILPPPEATERLKVPLDSPVSPSESTVRLSRESALEQGGADPRSVDPDATARLQRKDLVSPHEGTVLMPTVPPLGGGPLQARSGEPDTQPGQVPASAPTELVPVREMLPQVLEGHAAASDATLVLRAGEPALPPGDPSAHEGTMIMPLVRAAASEDTRPGLEAPSADTSAHEGTMLMPAVPAVAKDEPAAHEGTMLMPVVPEAAKDEPAAHEGTMLMPVVPEAAKDEPAAHEGTMLLPVKSEAAQDEPAAHEGTMLMPVLAPGPAPGPAPSRTEETRPDLLPPATPEAARGESSPEEIQAPAAPEPVPPAPAASAADVTVVTAADIIRQTFAEEPDAGARTIRVTQGSLPELRMPELPELAPAPGPAAPVEAEPDPELPRSTLHMPRRDMPETRQAPEPPPAPAAWAPPEPLLPAPALRAPAPEPTAAFPAPRTAAEAEPGLEAVPAARAQPAGAARTPLAAPSEPPRGASGLLWAGVIGGIAVVGGGLWAWNMGWLGSRTRTAPRGPGPGDGTVPLPPPRTEAEEAAAIPEHLRPTYEKALAGDPKSMRYLGVCYVNGLGVAANRTEGLKWYRRAAAAGSVAAQQDLQALEAQGIR